MDQLFSLDADVRMGKPAWSRLCIRGIVLAIVLCVGFWLRSLPPRSKPGPSSVWPWTSTKIATLYFRHGKFFFPVSRRITTDALPRAALQALIDGPSVESGLTSSIPSGVVIRDFQFSNGRARVDLSSGVLTRDADLVRAAEIAIIETLTALPNVKSVAVTVNDRVNGGVASRTPMLYYASANGLVAITVASRDPRSALSEYLSGPPDPQLSGLPSDVRLLSYEYNAAKELLALNFSYTSSLHTFALERPERMRTVLLGLIATLTEFPAVRAVQLDFEGHTRLGLGQCSDLLRTPQPHPTLLNDERLLGR